VQRAVDGATNSQHLSNPAWSFANLLISDAPLLSSISASAIPMIHDFSPQPIANTLWSYARLAKSDDPCLNALWFAAKFIL